MNELWHTERDRRSADEKIIDLQATVKALEAKVGRLEKIAAGTLGAQGISTWP